MYSYYIKNMGVGTYILPPATIVELYGQIYGRTSTDMITVDAKVYSINLIIIIPQLLSVLST